MDWILSLAARHQQESLASGTVWRDGSQGRLFHNLGMICRAQTLIERIDRHGAVPAFRQNEIWKKANPFYLI
jgi:hypothetical protein